MRLLHTADWHLGQILKGSYDRAAEHALFLDWLLAQVGTLEIDAILIAGDVFDVGNPPIIAQQRFYAFIRSALARRPHLQLVVVGGNHDSAQRLELPRALLGETRLTIVGGLPRGTDRRPDPTRCVVPLCDGSGRVRATCLAIPFLRPEDLPTLPGDGEMQAAMRVGRVYRQATEAALDRHPGLPVIALGHLTVTGAERSDQSERRILIGGEESISAGVFDPRLSLVALGHLHRAQEVPAAMPVRYSGSPLPLSMTERDYQHSVSLVTVAETGAVSCQTIPTPRPARFLRCPERGAAPLAEVLKALRALTLGDAAQGDRDLWPFLEVAVRLDAPEPRLRAQVEGALEGRAVRLLGVQREASAAAPLAVAAAIPRLAEMAPDAVFTQLHRDQHHGVAPTPELMAAFAQLLQGVQAQPAAGTP